MYVNTQKTEMNPLCVVHTDTTDVYNLCPHQSIYN